MYSAGLTQTQRSLGAALELCLDRLPGNGRRATRIAGVCVAMAGAGRDEEQRQVRDIVYQLLPSIACDTPVMVVPDVYGALVGGAGTKVGAVVVAGTGSMVWRRDSSGASARAGGWGYLMGDEGSGYDLGRKALQAVMQAKDKRGPRTLLVDMLTRHFDVVRPDELVKRVYAPAFSVYDVAALARLVLQAADDGDAVAATLLDVGSRELASGVLAVHTALGAEPTMHPVVLGGGLLRHTGYRQRVAGEIVSLVPVARPMPPEREAAYGAALLAAETVGWWCDRYEVPA